MKKLIVMIIIAITLGACSKLAGDNYIGDWQLDENNMLGKMPLMPVISIAKSGSVYVIKDVKGTYPIALGPCSGGATLKEDTKLYCQPTFAFAYDETTHKLLSPIGSFSKVN